MSILTKEEHKEWMKKIADRVSCFGCCVERRELKNSNEGCRRGCWNWPDEMCATEKDAIEVKSSIDDLIFILKEFRKKIK